VSAPPDPSAPTPGEPETVTIPRDVYDQLVVQAGAWQMLCASEHVLDLLAEWVEWDQRRTTAQTSHDVSAAVDWRLRAGAPSYAELARRRQLTTDTVCGACGTGVTLVHPLPDEHADHPDDLSWVRCDRCIATGPATPAAGRRSVA
jgi:hypothetical protein